MDLSLQAYMNFPFNPIESDDRQLARGFKHTRTYIPVGSYNSNLLDALIVMPEHGIVTYMALRHCKRDGEC